MHRLRLPRQRILLFPIIIALAAAVALVIILLNQPTVFTRHYDLLGTDVQISVCATHLQKSGAEKAIRAAYAEIQRLDRLMSTWKNDSDVSRINQAAGIHPVVVHPEVIEVLEHARHISELSGGAFDITFAPVGKLWSLDRANPRIPRPEEIKAALPLVNYRNVLINREASTVFLTQPGMAIGLGGIAKGTAVDWAINALKREGITDALVNAGGDLYALGLNAQGRPWRIGVHHPRNPHEFLTRFAVSNLAVVTSGDYERMVFINGKRYHHILDPKTGYPADKCISVTIIHPSTEFADGLATAVFVLGPGAGLELVERLPDTEALIACSDDTIFYSSGYSALFAH